MGVVWSTVIYLGQLFYSTPNHALLPLSLKSSVTKWLNVIGQSSVPRLVLSFNQCYWVWYGYLDQSACSKKSFEKVTNDDVSMLTTYYQEITWTRWPVSSPWMYVIIGSRRFWVIGRFSKIRQDNKKNYFFIKITIFFTWASGWVHGHCFTSFSAQPW